MTIFGESSYSYKLHIYALRCVYTERLNKLARYLLYIIYTTAILCVEIYDLILPNLYVRKSTVGEQKL